MAKILGIFLIVIAIWQLFVAIRIGRVARSDIPEVKRQLQIHRLNKVSKIVQITALIGVSIFIFMEV